MDKKALIQKPLDVERPLSHLKVIIILIGVGGARVFYRCTWRIKRGQVAT